MLRLLFVRHITMIKTKVAICAGAIFNPRSHIEDTE